MTVLYYRILSAILHVSSELKLLASAFISFVQMYSNPFFYFSIIFGCSRPGVFTGGVPPPCFRTAALINSWGCCFRGGGISHRPCCACLERTQVSPLCFWARCPLVPAPVRGFRWAPLRTIYCISARVTHLPSAEQSGRRRGPSVLVLGAACPSVRSPVPVNCVPESRTSSQVSKRNN